MERFAQDVISSVNNEYKGYLVHLRAPSTKKKVKFALKKFLIVFGEENM